MIIKSEYGYGLAVHPYPLSPVSSRDCARPPERQSECLQKHPHHRGWGLGESHPAVCGVLSRASWLPSKIHLLLPIVPELPSFLTSLLPSPTMFPGSLSKKKKTQLTLNSFSQVLCLERLKLR